MLRSEEIRAEFPIFSRIPDLCYLDTAATAQIPRVVLDAMRDFEETSRANVSRSPHRLAARATEAYEAARGEVAAFLGAASSDEIVLTSGTTMALNLVAEGFLRPRLGPGDRIVTTELEHHALLLPLQSVCRETGATLDAIGTRPDGTLDLADAERKLRQPGVRVLALAHVSNVTGEIRPVAELARIARDAGAVTIVDGAQSAPHLGVDVAELGANFFAFSRHKAYGPFGTGALWGRAELLADMQPLLLGGEMVSRVAFDEAEFREAPARFEAGTPNISGAVGLGAAIRFLRGFDPEMLRTQELELRRFAFATLREIPGVRVIGPEDGAGAISFSVGEVHPLDLGTVLGELGVCVRAGYHCAEPGCRALGLDRGTVRASLGIYSSEADVRRLADAILEATRILG